MITVEMAINSKQYYVYILGYNGIPFYIGKGKGERIYSHELLVKNPNSPKPFGIEKDYNPYKTRKIQNILDSGGGIEYSIEGLFLNEKDALDYEKFLIKKYGRKGIDINGILTNRTEGGVGGNTFLGLSETAKKERIEKLRIASTGRKKSPESIERTRQGNLGKVVSKESREKMSNSRKGKPSKRKGIPATGGNAKGVRKPWNKDLDINDPRRITHKESIQNWYKENDGKVGSIEYSLISPDGILVEGVGLNWLIRNYDVTTRIYNLILGNVDQYKGWIRSEDLGKIIPKKYKPRAAGCGIAKPVDQFDLNEIFIQSWKSIREAAISLKISAGSISNAIDQFTLNNTSRTSGGFIWKTKS